MAQQIQRAQELLPQIRNNLSHDTIVLMSRICTECNIGSLRADITLYKASTALSAWYGRTTVVPEDIRQAAQWVLSHRRRQRPLEGHQSQPPHQKQHQQ